MSNYLINIIGPTAIGKTSLSIKVARHFITEIISADSRQFFKEMKIGTAVPDKDELAAATHHFIQHISIADAYSVGDFEKDAILKLKELFNKHKVAVMVGGSGLYIKAITEGLDDFPKVDPEIRRNLNQHLEEDGIDWLQKKLYVLDPEYYKTADVMNPHRLIRALEICIETGKPFSSFLNQKKPERNFKNITIGLMADREMIYDRINKRVDLMIRNGLIEEARELYPQKELNALNTVGYKELFSFFDGKTDLETAISEIKKNTRRFAKRQLTWFRKDPEIKWFEFDENSKNIFDYIESKINT
ncbi:tRNA (adenosine(37)-N6)-dimethylallyltransferase MiaA [Christiangramia forsetii]|uniref:tRNA dimethylallyltransferase n=2 Tax=Christiangramia forsetii TaxID=411153 RepID=MIAA_CHRFK|nr:tRNA (adenosine(37)-N6)-dimethylallyltransferase MiaA [Christiangramia forsetii]A0LZ43.1 RecName: Full=tRNA dimethylallyltransferase; AltName: Full=Dimethylallyl diphosphate:tRNA dimethylallyltransferase; Short=DMAPP:tRNA dimethylallyltransferase; Short=DMATase; AltName: Full=Isopentenyl-diphosphate:tRNA isopentenyltransferase; Short=IPP transferase; Short=IPPT; Short=IPTase [Christiangramia forsetii KT0803]GGG37389.1 tRNA dimethylallyltransferase [Christiangramia forsetii]CAL65638.1 tRNA del